jgi:nitrogen fixation-related uncharacterized protein
MIALSINSALLAIWVTFAVVALGGIAAVLVWAVRSRQFAGQERARYLALQSGIPREDRGDDGFNG